MSETTSRLTARPARLQDAAAITAIYNEGIADRVGTFETEPRTVDQIEAWFEHAKAFVAVEDDQGQVVGYAVAHPYASRPCYAGVSEFSVYIRRSAREAGLWKLLSRVFPENRASLNLMAWSGFKAIGVHEKHGKLDGVWRDCVIVERVLPENLD